MAQRNLVNAKSSCFIPTLPSRKRENIDLVSAFLSNSRTLFTLNSMGRILRWFWPHIDYEQHVKEFSLGLEVGGQVFWQDEPAEEGSPLGLTEAQKRAKKPSNCNPRVEQYTGGQYTVEQYVEERSFATVTVIRFPLQSLEWRIRDVLLRDRDLLLREMTVQNTGKTRRLGLWSYAHFEISESPFANTIYYDAPGEAIIAYRKGVYLGFNASLPISRFTCAPYSDSLESGVKMGIPISQGDVCSLCFWDLGEIRRNRSKSLTLAIGAEESKERIEGLLNSWKDVETQEALANQLPRYIEELLSPVRKAYSIKGIHPGKTAEKDFFAPKAASFGVEKMLETSVLVLDGLRDSQGGGFIAGPEFDLTYSQSGGYGYCWGRDASYITMALDSLGYHSMSSDLYLKWARKAQSKDGGFLHRHYSDGVLAPSWGFLQIDETASILLGAQYHAEKTGDPEFIREFSPCALKAAEYLLSIIDPSDGLPIPCFDLWEERIGKHLYTSAAVAAGLKAGAFFAQKAQMADFQASLLKAHDVLRERTLQSFWDENRAIFARALYPRFPDETPDASILGIIYPFKILTPDDPKAKSTVERIEKELTSKRVGGLFRYAGDVYAGGNPWVVTTLWLGLVEVLSGQKEKALSRLQWALQHATSLWLLPEQVDKTTGQPKWVIPLAWSHAMFVLLTVGIFREER